jgi:hypothetical protein
MTHVIEKGVPMPTQDWRIKSGLNQTLLSMEVGDSVVLNKSERNGLGAMSQRLGRRFTVRKIDDTTFRAWRLE